jgi:hypothetical protein
VLDVYYTMDFTLSIKYRQIHASCLHVTAASCRKRPTGDKRPAETDPTPPIAGANFKNSSQSSNEMEIETHGMFTVASIICKG